MIVPWRKILTSGTTYGLLLTAVMALSAGLGLFDHLESWCYDRRAATFQVFTPPPTDRLVHLDIDDAAFESIGSWPWHRATLAEIVDELRIAGPKAIAWDVLFSEPQGVRAVQGKNGTYDKIIDDDQLFAESLERFGHALMPLSLPIRTITPVTPGQQKLREIVKANLELTEQEARTAVKDAKIASADTDYEQFLQVRRDMIYERVGDELRRDLKLTVDELKPKLFPKTDPTMSTPVFRVLEEQYARVTTGGSLTKLTRAFTPDLPPMLDVKGSIPPIPSFARAASATAFFDYPTERGGTVRRVPLFMQHEGRVYPHISIGLALMQMGADLNSIRITDHTVTIPREGSSPVVLPVYTFVPESLGRPVPMMFDIPWFGTDKWETMYDKIGGAHLSMNFVWDACLTRRRIEKNNAEADDAIKAIYELQAPEKLQPYLKHLPSPDDTDTRLSIVQAIMNDLGTTDEAAGSVDQFDRAEKTRREDVQSEVEFNNTQNFAKAGRGLRNFLREGPLLRRQLDARRRELHQRMHDRSILVGWAATASLTDFVPTSIHPRVPGVVIHGTIFSAILTAEFWRRVPPWVNLLIVVSMGLVATFLAARLSPSRALVYSLMLGVLYIIVNGLFIFDWGNRIVSVGAPAVTVAVVWAGCTVARLLVESWERARITSRFQNYVDPALVNYFVAHPEKLSLEGEMRELTVVFTDLEGFTKLTEQLGERAVRVLNEFMAVAVPIIRNHNGYVNKFLGDGIMFFFGAPLEVKNHATLAVRTVLDLCGAMRGLNESLVARGFPPLSLRAGISTGEMVVGDAGMRDARDYTVLGDCVNLGARLESANKVIGSSCLISGRTIELVDGEFLMRPVGKLRVVGKQHGVMTYEALASMKKATAAQTCLAELSKKIVDCYLAGDIPTCLAAVEQMETQIGRSKFTAVYRDQCEAYLRNPNPDTFDHAISLTEK